MSQVKRQMEAAYEYDGAAYEALHQHGWISACSICGKEREQMLALDATLAQLADKLEENPLDFPDLSHFKTRADLIAEWKHIVTLFMACDCNN